MPEGPSPAPRPPSPNAAGGGGLGRKIGPLPAWAWGGILVGMVAFIFLVRGNTSKGGGDGEGEENIPTDDMMTTAAADAARLAALAALFAPGGGSPGGNGSPSLGDPRLGVCPVGYHPANGICVPDVGYTPPEEIEEIPIGRRPPPEAARGGMGPGRGMGPLDIINGPPMPIWYKGTGKEDVYWSTKVG